ncbi:tyrosine 3-monooxygenase-like [Formica exsecta]|uniref:tyrosine 3-monooxygenase-like n=1 Tax=Formica exsecta TaxID=72781 RepID=UPI001144568C|nr:tyrosine 3-monooxygenase-like [Formica exsecta]
MEGETVAIVDGIRDECSADTWDSGLTEEEIVLAKTIAESPESEQGVQKAALVLRLREGIGSLGRILKTIENFKGIITHVESRPSKKEGLQFEVLVKIDMSKQSLLQLIRNLRQSSALDGVTLLADNSVSIKDPWFPRHASELDNCNHLMTKYEPDLDMSHPGFADKEYRARRKVIAEIAFAYKYGDPIPSIPYTETENETWSRVFITVLDLVPKHACVEYQRVFKKLQEERIFEPHRIPQLQEVSDFLKKSTGFTLRPAAGLLTARDFLSSLAFRIFQSTQYIRHINSPYHTPEPDCIHELLGHMPLLADPSFAQFSQEIGLASLGASDEEIEKLSTIYWFTIEFGLCKEGTEIKAYGAEFGCTENGYPARRRSLVDDARFETLVVKQTKQSVLEEARQRANDTNADQTITCTQEQQGQGEHYVDVSSSDDEQVESLICAAKKEEAKAEASDSDGKPDEDDDDDSGLTEEEIVLAKTIAESPESEQGVQKAALVLRLREGIGSLGRILKTIENFKGIITHVESRPSKKEGLQFEVLVKIDMSKQSLLQLIRNLRQSSALDGVTLLADNSVSIKDPWFPRHASELDNCNHLMTKYEPDLDMSHPGFADKEYRARRKVIAEIAFAYKYGDPIPSIPYTETENETWSRVFITVLDLVPKHACVEYQRVFKKLQEERIFEPHRIPQLQEVSDFLKKSTGFTLRPAAGLLTARDFLSSLAFRIFQSTQYIRHINSPYHTPEPDCIHELLGHMPLLADPSFAQFSQEIGLASLGASDEEIEKLSTIYWFTIEFGLCKEGTEIKAYGAGLLSAYGELLHALSDKCEHRSFDPSTTALQKYQDQEYQPIYYVAESFDDAKEKFRRWVATMSRPFEVRYNPHTQRVEVLDSVDRLEDLISQLNTEMTHLTNAVNKMKAKHFA